MIKIVSAEKHARKYRDECKKLIPIANFGDAGDISSQMLDSFETAVESDREQLIHEAFEAHPYALQYAIDQSGHHGTWLISKQMIRTSIKGQSSGLIPDFLAFTRSSLGLFAWVVELKRPSMNFCKINGTPSANGSNALTQLNNYSDHIANFIETVRSNSGLENLRAPIGKLLLMGRSSSETVAQTHGRRLFNKPFEQQIVSYDRIIHGISFDLQSRLNWTDRT
ncbi:Shedu anti-phage system protein SduA domain-containing protein [Sphingomicrobium arenosum]|uniref:Shedu anti-phage system protein SduA domain-containing protein n=1 Tax=Sphingomicrobium arenosum TaxID=2233861 RepID=UPI0022404B5D|nr:Shedu anti-phage system protein SduA domain-containing protein [Sphingomicrobium arenosum]